MKTVRIALGGLPLELTMRSEAYFPSLEPFLTQEPPETRAVPAPEGGTPYEEFMRLCLMSSDALLPFGRVVMHGVALLWRGRAWLLTGPSGTGKTTQYILWKEQFPGEVEILNGDKPVLELRGRTPWLHASPWTGKEGMARRGCAPLGGIILLEQGQDNEMSRLMPGQGAAGRLMVQLLISRSTPEQVRQAAGILQTVLEGTPLWLLRNRGDPASARLCHDILEKEVPV